MDDIGSTAVTAAERSNSDARQGDHLARRRFLPPAPAKRTISDVATLLCGADGMSSESVAQSIAALVEEIERLRREVDLSRHYENFLGEEADRHPTLPVLNRRALMRALGQLLVASEQAEVPGSLLYLHVGGIERLRVLHGLAASDAALTHVAQLMRSEFRQTDLIGYLDGGDFAVALALAEPAAAMEKARSLAEHLAEQPLVWQDNRFLFTIAFGLAHFRADLSAEATLALADAVRRGVSLPDGSLIENEGRFESNGDALP
jgi:diguanylate cyclase (GGDEF)-like protein